VEPSRAPIQTTACAIRQVRWSFPSVQCTRCGGAAPRLWDATRVAVDIDVDHPVLLAVVVGVHVCPVCSRMFRAQPLFLRPRAVYTQRVVHKAVETVYRDGLAMRTVPDRLARDFWVTGNLGAGHGVEVPFVFGTLDTADESGEVVGVDDDAEGLSTRMQDAWIAFARKGTPLGICQIGIPSSTDCLARSAATGLACPCAPVTRCWPSCGAQSPRPTGSPERSFSLETTRKVRKSATLTWMP
jgi:hypothetical protein